MVLAFAQTRTHKSFAELSEREMLALAITLEEEDGRIYRDYARAFAESYPATARVFHDMAEEESGHRRMLIELFRQKFGEHIPLVRRDDVLGFVRRKPLWLATTPDPDEALRQAEGLEEETRNFYEQAAKRSTDASVRKLLVDLAEAEAEHARVADRSEHEHRTPDVKRQEGEAKRRLFVLQIVQPALAGLMDGSVSTLAPVFAAAFATGSSWDAFLVGMAASVGAGISMGFTEALSDDGVLTGRGHPAVRGTVCGLATTVGGVGHTLPYLIPDFWTATALAVAVVLVELFVIAWIRARYMDTPFLKAAFQVVVGGLLVFAAGIAIGNA